MFKNLQRIPTIGMSREDWLAHRQNTIGGSDAAAVVGLNPFSSPYTVWADKLGKLAPKEETEAMRIGHDLEDYVAKRFTEATGKKVRRENAILCNPDYPFAHANVDRMIVGEDAGLECKTTSSLNLKRFASGDYPATYYVQCVHYMMITGCKKWYLAVLILGKDFLWFEIERDEDEIKALAESEEAFWRYVESQEPPAADGAESTSETIKAIYPDSDGSEIDLNSFTADMQTYLALKARIKELETDVKDIENRIKSYMADAERGYSDAHTIKWATQERKTFDAKRFAADHPAVDLGKYYNVTKFRKFDIKERKEA